MNLKRKCLELRGSKSHTALTAFYNLMIGLRMAPSYQHYSLEEFFSVVEAMEPEDRLKVIITGAKIVPLQDDEIRALVCFCTDKNGVPYTSENLKNLGPSDLVEIIATVCFELSNCIHVDLLSPDEKKN